MLSDIEKEVIVLKAIKELIDSIVNFEVLMLGDSDPTETRFKTMTHAKFFNIVLVDLLSKTDKKGLIGSEPYLATLKKITQSPHFNVNNSVVSLRNSTHEFVSWLQTTITIDKVWLPTVWTEINLKLTRIELVKTAGNISRHNFLRAVGIAEDVRKILKRSGVSIDLDQALLVLSDLYEWLHTDVFHYHSSTIAEFLNNIRWDIYGYLRPEYSRSIVWEGGDPPRYRFTYPNGISSNFAKECYWGLMNEVHRPPYMRRFQVTEWLKKQY
jgi:hypothetical protein